MTIREIKTEDFEDLIENNQIVVVDLWAEWCAPCKQFAKIYERVAKQNPTIQFVKINVEEESKLAEIFQIRSIPHLMIFKQGIAIYSEAGSMPESVLNDLVQQAIKVDVSAIRTNLDEEEQG
ncbi:MULTISPECIES: co-chaperone YbbN [unclassified Legionella]|uniref:thioredoxin family protein n=1 Tax=unclassified Legionella TaxID=2622702 RepID=UPI0010543CAC|nr:MULTISPECIES: thioredoxin family protein [unclassified Legionella]MDI9819721.1 thioredoxin family protein [Legionella sp. PL877]